MTRYILIGSCLLLLGLTNACQRAGFTDVGTLETPSSVDELDIATDNTDEGIPLEEIPACDPGSTNEELNLCTTLKDSFERSSILDASGPSFGWSKVIDDAGSANGLRVDATIYSKADMGETPLAITGSETDNGRALYFTGRQGASVHSIYLISKAFDLSAFQYLTIRYDYLAMDLETWSWRRKSGQENIRLEICVAGEEACNDDLNGDSWETLAQSEDNAGDGLNGHNQTLADWDSETVQVDLSWLSDVALESFVFRIAVTLDEGFSQYNPDDTPVLTSNLLDGVALDNVLAIVSKNPIFLDGQ
jgi:hypothetical protein